MKNLTIIGFGNIGQVLARELKPHFNVTVANRSDKSETAKQLGVRFTQDNANSVKEADYVILAIHINVMNEIINQIKDNIKKDCIVMDTCTVKEKPMELMSKLGCKVIGTHPQFRKVDSVKGKSIIICGEPDQYFCDILKKIGLNIIEMDAAEHDRQMAVVSLINLIGLNLLDFFDDNEMEILKATAGAASRNTIPMLEMMKANSLETYTDAQIANPYAIEKRKRFIQLLQEFDGKMERKRI